MVTHLPLLQTHTKMRQIVRFVPVLAIMLCLSCKSSQKLETTVTNDLKTHFQNHQFQLSLNDTVTWFVWNNDSDTVPSQKRQMIRSSNVNLFEDKTDTTKQTNVQASETKKTTKPYIPDETPVDWWLVAKGLLAIAIILFIVRHR